MKSDYLVLSLKNLRHRGLRSWLTLIGIFIGITTVVSLITLGSGLKAAVNSQFGVASTEVITVQAGGINGFGPPGSGVENHLTEDDVEAIEKLSTIDIALGRNVETFKIEYNDKVQFNPGFGVNEGEKRKWDYEMQDLEASKGRLLDDGDSGKVFLGNNYADKDKGGFDKSIEVGDKIKLNDRNFKVIGILESKGSFIIDNAVVINKEDLEKLADNNGNADVISVKVKNKDEIDKAKEDIEKLLRKRRDVEQGSEDFEVSTPQQTLEDVNNILNGIQVFIIIIASISIAVGALGIANTMTTSVLERKKDIGIMKSIGAKNSDIFYQFFTESGLLGLIGGVIGVIFGLLIGMLGIWAINNFIGADTQMQFDFILIFGTLIGSFLVGGLSGIIPAMNAANQNPVDALR